MICPSGKQRYETGRVALRALQAINARRGGRRGRSGDREVAVYRCPDCDGWHLSSPTRRMRP